MRILLATSNPHKLAEIAAVFDQMCARTEEEAESRQIGGECSVGPLVELVGLSDLDQHLPEPVEDQDTFEANAVVKALHYAQHTHMLCLADDSGLVVDALGGEPGVRSARYGGVTGTHEVVDPANNRLLLQKLAHVPAKQRTARFICAMALCSAQQNQPLAIVRGTVEGRILGPGDDGYRGDPAVDYHGRGDNGFGYDPLFLLPDLGKTTAELSPDQKNAISHRGDAARLMWGQLQRIAARLVV